MTPAYYLMPDGVTQVADVSRHLSSNGGQAVQYIARATRLDGTYKGNRLQDLAKAVDMLEDEMKRILLCEG